MLPLVVLGLCFAGLLAIRWPSAILVAFGLVAPFGLASLPGSMQLITLASAGVIGLALMDTLWSGRLPVPASVAGWSATAWSIGAVTSAALAEDPARAAVFGAWQIIAAWLAVSLAIAAGRPDRMRWALGAWLLGAVVIGISGVVQDEGGVEAAFGGGVVSGRAVGVFAQPNEFGTYCMMMAVFCSGLAVMTRGSLRVLAAAAGVACAQGLVISFSRGAWVGAVAGAVLLILLAPAVRRPAALALLTVGTVLAVVLAVLPDWQFPSIMVDRVRSIFNPEANPFDDRPALRAEGLREFAERPVVGQGPNMFLPQSTDVDSLARTVAGEHPHNFWIAIGAEQGIVGLLSVLGMAVAVGLALASSRRHLVARGPLAHGGEARRPGTVPLGAAITVSASAAIGAFLVSGLVDYPMRNALVRTSVWAMVGLALAGHRLLRFDSGSPAPPSPACGAAHVEAPRY